jgi:hypothetical protein
MSRLKPKCLKGTVTLVGVLLALVLAGGFGWVFLARSDEWVFRRNLPGTAVDVSEWDRSETLLPDYSYHLKASITEEQFGIYITKFGLTPHSETRQYSQSPSPWLSWQAAPGFQGSWWDPSDTLAGTFVHQEGDTWTFAKYENGYLYLASLNH